MSDGVPHDGTGRSGWTFLTNHAHVLLAIARTPDLRLRDIAGLVGITERTATQIIADLVDGGYVIRQREGRRNHYRVDLHHPLRHPLEQHHDLAELVRAIGHRDPV
jgi:DNA-binding IclR family transcriptional regulator